MTRILILYRELAGYMVSCINYLATQHQISIDIVAYPVNAEAPFTFQFAPSVRIFRRGEHSAESIQKLVDENRYDLIFCGGWSDTLYLQVVRRNAEIASVLAFDKQWLGSPRDRIAALYLRFRLTRLFRWAFVPGGEQVEFARRMGFKPGQIKEGVYCCDHELFEAIYSRRNEFPSSTPRQIWYSGRYIEAKCVTEVQHHIAGLLDSELPDWELHCIGTGALYDQRLSHPRIIHHGFVQPEDLPDLITRGEINILPSKFEPWALSVHEFATAGFALVVSDRVGARTAFVEHESNGLIFPSEDWEAFKSAVLALCRKSPEELRQMGARSHRLAAGISHARWANTVMDMVKSGNKQGALLTFAD
jgi:glycosyltransferase involved in cell wall biosynthesis